MSGLPIILSLSAFACEEEESKDYKRRRIDIETELQSIGGNFDIQHLSSPTPFEEDEGQEDNLIVLPNEMMMEIFKKVPLKDFINISQACKEWHSLIQSNEFWYAVRLENHGDYSADKASKENAIYHAFRVLINTLPDPNQIENLIRKYQLDKDPPFAKY